MILSILDTDLYKFTTSYAYMKLYPNAIGTFEYVDRNNTVYDDDFLYKLEEALNEVMKLIEVQLNSNSPKLPCIKRSDDKGKRLGNATQHDILDHVLSYAA